MSLEIILLLLVGAATGALVVGLLLRYRIKRYETTRGEAETELATLRERLSSRDRELTEAKVTLERVQTESTALRHELRSESSARATAEEKNSRIPAIEAELASRENQITALQAGNARLQAQVAGLEATLHEEREAAVEKLALLEDAKEVLSTKFEALSARALRNNNQSFLELAREQLGQFQQGAQSDLESRQRAIDELVKPLKVSLEKVDDRVQEIEHARTSAYTLLTEQVRSLLETQSLLRLETTNLVKAFRTPHVAGMWGQLQLKRVVEIAGMVEYCDFEQQTTLHTDDGLRRPDMIVRLPNNRIIVVDSKAPTQAYIDAIQAEDETTRLAKLKDHARLVKDHIVQLSNRSYWQHLTPTPEFVVLFLPAESLFRAALEQAPELIQTGANEQVMLASPTTLIALLKAVHYGWKQEQLAKNAQEVSKLGQELYDRIKKFAQHFNDIGKNLEKAIDAYNAGVGSLISRVLVTAKRFKELEASNDEEIDEPQMIDKIARSMQDTGFLPGLTGDGIPPGAERGEADNPAEEARDDDGF